MNLQAIRAPLRAAVLTLFAGLVFAAGATAQSNTNGNVVGKASAGDIVTVVNPKTGFSRTVEVGKKGRYRVASLPVGVYTVTVKHGDVVVLSKPVAVQIGRSTMVVADPVK